MKRVICFVDGFNLYHSIDELKRPFFKWLNLKHLAQQFLKADETLQEVYYFTAYANWNTDKRDRHKRYVRALKTEGVQVVLGTFKRKYLKCRRCQQRFRSFEEKRTDVNIALHLYALAAGDTYDTALIISGDGDLYPAVEMIKKDYPNKRVGIVFPMNRHRGDLNQLADFDFAIQENHLRAARLPDAIVLKDGTTLTCPAEWK